MWGVELYVLLLRSESESDLSEANESSILFIAKISQPFCMTPIHKRAGYMRTCHENHAGVVCGSLRLPYVRHTRTLSVSQETLA